MPEAGEAKGVGVWRGRLDIVVLEVGVADLDEFLGMPKRKRTKELSISTLKPFRDASKNNSSIG
jgi:hypothetical protein